MKSRICTVFLLLLVSVAAGHGPVLAAEEDLPPSNEGISLDFRDVELTELIRTVSEMTGKNFIFDESVKGKATIISPRSLTPGEAYEAFLAVLNVKGYTVVPSGKMHKIVPLRDAKMTNLPTGFEDGRGTEHYVTRLIRLENIDAETVANSVLNSLVPKTSQIAVYGPTNTLIITDNSANIERLRKIVAQLDVESGIETIEVLQLEHSTAEEVASAANEVFSQQSSSSRRRRSNATTAGAEAAKIIPFDRTNTLILAGTPEDLANIRLLVDKLDQEATRNRAEINVFYLTNADAETMAETLNNILGDIESESGGTRRDANQAEPSVSEVTVTADKPTNSLIVNSTSEDYETMSRIIEQLDTPRKQVFVEALILELSLDAVKQLGVSLQGGVAVDDDSLTFGTSNLNSGQVGLGDLAPGSEASQIPSLLTQTVNGILLGGLFNPIEVMGPNGDLISVPAFSALIDLAKGNTDVNILSAPRLLTLDNEEAEIVVGSNVPIITERLSDTSNVDAQRVSVERQDVALTLQLTPQITEGALVRLDVLQEITEIAPTNASVGNVNDVGPTLTKRLLTNTVVVEDGRTAVLGGLISSNKQTQVSKVPFLGDIPLLGWLFRSKKDSERKTSLMVFMTPRIIRSPGDLEDVTRNNRRATERFRSGQTQQEVIEESYKPEGQKVLIPEINDSATEAIEDGI
ncbi:MAG: type II secretion system secretin GspD [Desulfuromonadales bacterium]